MERENKRKYTSSDSESDESNSSRGHKKHKKHKHEKKERKHKDKKDDREKKDKKHKRDKNHPSSIDQNEYGKYGIIREEHFFQKQREFEVYMEEVKGIAGVLGGSKREIMEHFKSFMEDYNTATMPHKKFYNYEMWEMLEYSKLKAREAEAEGEDVLQNRFKNDEDMHRRERKRLKEEEDRKAFAKVKERLASDRDAVESMKRQSHIALEMQLAYKRGDTETLKRLERSIAPSKPAEVEEHPWS